MSDRLAQIATNYEWVKQEISKACAAVGRSSADVTLIAVSKTWPASDVRLLHSLGHRDFGENRAQEALPKSASLFDLDINWHHIGQIQTNKAGQIVRYANYIHSIDRVKAAAAVSRAAQVAEKQIGLFVQIALEPPTNPERAGADFQTALEIAREIQPMRNVSLRGLMAVAPLGENPELAFSRIRPLQMAFNTQFPQATELSLGMSGDFREAIAAGATHIRIGSLLFGNRGLK